MKIENNKKEHRNRKNPRAHELHKQANHNHNALRPKQVFVNGNWTRVPVVAPSDIVDEACGVIR